MAYLLQENGYKILLENGGGILLDSPLTLSAQVANSDYKWLTSSLKTAQQNPPYVPNFNLKILDDTLNPYSILTNPTVPVLGDATTSPDGYVLCAGGDGSGNLKFWKLSDASQSFPSGTTLVSSGTGYVSTLNTSIACSDWINGSYVIDVFFFYSGGGSYYPAHARSLNGGTTWAINPYSLPAGFTGLTTTDDNYIAAGQPIYDPVQMVTKATAFYIRGGLGASNAFYKICYIQYDGGSSFLPEVQWPTNVDSQDWTLHSLDTQYLNGSFYIFFAGFHNWFETPSGNSNYSIYMAQLNNLTNNSSTDQWQLPIEILTSTSPQSTNNNAFTFPRITTDGSLFYLLFSAAVGEGLTTANSASSNVGSITNNYYYLMWSADMINFTYPLPLYFTDGTIYADAAGVSFVNQNSNYFILGNGQNWQYLKNNIVADITNYVISYQIQEVAGQSSQISITLGNANNYWIGTGASGVGAAAIATNKKIILEQGYTTSVGKEVAPRNIFYIDSITLNISSSDNAATIQGRDINRNLQNVSTKFSYSINGPSYYNDLFDGTTLQNWSQNGGAWIESGNLLKDNTPSGSMDTAINGSINNNAESSIIFTMFDAPSIGDSVNIIPLWQDYENYFSITITNNDGVLQLTFTVDIDGTSSSTTAANICNYTSGRMPIFVRKYNYFQYAVLIGSPYGSAGVMAYPDNVLDTTSNYQPFYPFLTDISSYPFTNSTFLSNGSIGVGATNSSGNFGPFKFMQFSESLSLQESLEYLCAISGITDLDPRLTFFDNRYLSSDWNGNYEIQNSYMMLSPDSLVINTGNQLSNGEIEFVATANPVISDNSYGFYFLFRASGDTTPFPSYENAYLMDIEWNSADQIVVASLLLLTGGNNIILATSAFTDYNQIPIDLTKQHTYKVTMIDQIFYLFIDGRVYFMWQDTNQTLQLSNGYWGIGTFNNTTLTTGNFTSYELYTQIPNVSFNPGDDMTSILQNVLETLFCYSYTDQLGRYVGIVLNSTDPSDYTYQNLLYTLQAQGVSSSIVNEVIVTGSGVIATYKDPALIAEIGAVWSNNITDYTITTYQDALSRAITEMISNNALASQNTPNNPMNVGSELFDVITIVNTGNNSTSVDGNYRVFNQTFTLDGSKGQYSINIETGSLTTS